MSRTIVPTSHGAPARIALGLLCASTLAGCAAVVPSRSSGTSVPSFGTPADIPERITLNSQRIQVYDPAGDVFRAELLDLGFKVVPQADDADAVLAVKVKYSDMSPVHLEAELSDITTGRILWKANVSREWDVYASVVKATEDNANKAAALLRHDLAAVRGRSTVPK